MKPLRLLTAFALLAIVSSASQDGAPTVTQTSQHEWLKQLVGEWTMQSEAVMAEGADPMQFDATETVKSFGDLWILAEGRGDFGGMKHGSMMTLGYDPNKKAFVGTWIDTMTAYLWVYRGTLDESKKVLTLEAEGPSFGDPNEMAQYRDVITIVDKDHKTLTSSMLGDDGEWTQFMKAEYTRKK